MSYSYFWSFAMAMFRKPNPKTGSAAVARERLLWCVEDRAFKQWKARHDAEWLRRDIQTAAEMRGYWSRHGLTTAKARVSVGANLPPQVQAERVVYRWIWKRTP